MVFVGDLDSESNWYSVIHKVLFGGKDFHLINGKKFLEGLENGMPRSGIPLVNKFIFNREVLSPRSTTFRSRRWILIHPDESY